MTTKTSDVAKNENRLARVWAKILIDEYHHWHRGAFHCGGKHRVLFGNDGYRPDKRAQAEVQIVRRNLEALGVKVKGFAVSRCGYTWAIVIENPRTKVFDRMVWDAWFEACGWSEEDRRELWKEAEMAA